MPVLLRIAMRNLREHRAKTLIIGLIIAIGIAVLVAGNSLAETAARGLRTSFIESFTGHIMISGKSERELSLFGYAVQTGNEEIPRIGSYRAVYAHVAALPEVAAVNPQLTGFAIMHADPEQNEDFFTLLFGVDPASYADMFPDSIELIEGSPLSPATPGLLLPVGQLEDMEERLGVDLQVGDPILMTGIGGNGIRIRELPITGVFRFRQENELLRQLTIIDAQTLRALTGLVVSTGQVELSAAETEMLGAVDLDAMFGEDGFGEDGFGDVAESDQQAAGGELSEQSVLEILGDAPRAPPVVDAGAWHFLLVRLNDQLGSEAAVATRLIVELNAWFEAQGINAVAVDWRTAAGGFARLASVVQSVFNGAIVVIAVVAIIIIMNTLVISVIERTSEIGTMRALGAHKRFVRRMFLLETLTISWVFGVAGIVLGAIIIGILGLTGIRASSDFLNILFGGEVLKPVLSAGSVILSLIIVTAIGLVASIYPVMVALRVEPIRAVQSE